MAITPAARDELEVLRILDEGKFAEKKYVLPEVLRRYNVSQAEYNNLKKNFLVPEFPIPFDSLELAMSYVCGHYEDCQLKLSEKGRFYVEAVRFEVMDSTEPETDLAPEIPMANKEKGDRHRRMTPDEVECIANELIEQTKTIKEIAETWGTAFSTVYAIKAGKHRHLNDKMKKELASHFEIARKHQAIPSIIPQKKSKKKKKGYAKKVSTKVAKKKVEEDQPTVRTELVIPRRQRDLDLIMKELRGLMRGQQIDSISLKANGEVTILRKEVFRLEYNPQ